MFLYGMKLMGNSLKESSSGTFKKAMEMVTNNPIKAFLLDELDDTDYAKKSETSAFNKK